MRIVFWNIRAGGGVRVGRIARQLKKWRPAIAVLCEFRATPPSCELARLLGGAGFVHQRATTSAEHPARNGILVASRLPVRRLHVRHAPSEHVRWLLVRVAAAEPFTLGAMHIPNHATGRKGVFHESVGELASRWRGGPALLIGDTNSGYPGIDEETRVFGPGETRFLDTLARADWVDAYRHVHGQKIAFTWYSPNGNNGFRLDQAFVNPSLLPRLRRAAYEWPGGRRHGLSDHAAMIVDLAEPSGDSAELKRAADQVLGKGLRRADA